MNKRNKTWPRWITWLRQSRLFRSEAFFTNVVFIIPTCILAIYLAVDVGLNTYRACTSQGRNAIIQAVRSDPILMGYLGEIEKTRCLVGTDYSNSDYANGTVWMTVRGTADEGMLYARYMKSKGVWWLTSAQMDLRHAGSLFIEGLRPDISSRMASSRLRIDRMDEDDYPLKADRSSAGTWSAVSWPEQRIDLEVPASWRVTRRTDDEFYLFSSTSDLHLIIRVMPNPNIHSTLRFINDLEHKEHRWWNKGHIRPSIFSNIGNLRGYISWPRQGAKSVVWFGVRDHPTLGADRVTFLFGASSSALFESNRPLFGAILASVKAYD